MQICSAAASRWGRIGSSTAASADAKVCSSINPLFRCYAGSVAHGSTAWLTTEAIGQASHGGVRDTGLSRDLTQSGARNEPVKDRLEEVAPVQPGVDGEGL